jgi:hypothetical protein
MCTHTYDVTNNSKLTLCIYMFCKILNFLFIHKLNDNNFVYNVEIGKQKLLPS